MRQVTRYNALNMPTKDFWDKYISRRSEFEDGTYVLLTNGQLTSFATEPPTTVSDHPTSIEFIHKAFAGDLAFYQESQQSNNNLQTKSTIPKELFDSLVSLHQTLESKTGKLYQISIKELYHDNDVVIGDLTNRKNGIQVYLTKPDYSKLEGNYVSLDALRTKIEYLSLMYFAEDVQLINTTNAAPMKPPDDTLDTPIIRRDPKTPTSAWNWKCKHCHLWGTSDGRIKNSALSSCHNCNFRQERGPWNGLFVDEKSGRIYQSGGGSIAPCYTIGFIRYI